MGLYICYDSVFSVYLQALFYSHLNTYRPLVTLSRKLCYVKVQVKIIQ